MSEVPQDRQQSQLLAIPASKKAYKPRTSRKAPAIKRIVLAKRVQGQNITSIANDLGITRNTTRTIIAEANLDQIMQDGQIETLKRVPAALKTLDTRLEKNSENAALWLLDKCFEGKQIARVIEPGLTLAIQNLLGNVQVNGGPTATTTTNSALAEKTPQIIEPTPQVIENK
jgi:transposase-like protein